MVWTMATFIGFTILVAVISYVKTKDDDQSTADGYFLAGRGLPGFVIAGSLLLTNLGSCRTRPARPAAHRRGASTIGYAPRRC